MCAWKMIKWSLKCNVYWRWRIAVRSERSRDPPMAGTEKLFRVSIRGPYHWHKRGISIFGTRKTEKLRRCKVYAHLTFIFELDARLESSLIYTRIFLAASKQRRAPATANNKHDIRTFKKDGKTVHDSQHRRASGVDTSPRPASTLAQQQNTHVNHVNYISRPRGE